MPQALDVTTSLWRQYPTGEPYDALGLADDVRRRILIGRFGGMTGFALGGLLLLLAALSDGSALDRTSMAATGGFGVLAGVVLTSVPWRIPVWVMDAMNVFAAIDLVVVAHLSPTIRPALPGVYVISGTTLFAMRSWRAAAGHTSMMGASYAVVLATAGPPVYAPVTRWVAVMAAVVTTGAFIRWLVSTVGGIAAREHEAWREAERATVELERIGRAKNEFLARMSHELRTPLNVVLGFADLLRLGLAGPLNTRQHEYAGDIAESARHLVSLVDDVLDPDRVARGEIELLMELVDVPTVLGEAVRLIRESAAAGGIRLEVDIAPSIDPIYVDRRKLRQVVVNLLVNAVKFTPPGGRVRLTAEQRDGELVVAVEDTGIGIAQGDLDRIFEEFARSATSVEGTGLGLPLTRRFIELHGGRLGVTSVSGAGSTFTVELPYRTPSVHRAEEPVSAPPAMSDHAAFTLPGSEPNRELLALLGSWFAVVAGTLLLVFAVITPVTVEVRLALCAAALTAYATAVVSRHAATRVNTRGVEAFGLFGIIAVTLCTAWAGPFSDLVPFLYSWITMTTFALWPRRRGIAHLIGIGVCYAILLAVRPEARSLGGALSVVTVVSAAGFMSAYLLNRLRRLVVAEQTARVHAEEVRARLDSASRHKDAFLANMSHELRTPLNAVVGFADLLSSEAPGPLSERQAEYVEDVRSSARHLLALINDILDLAKVEAGRLQLELDVVSIPALLEHTAGVVSAAAAAHGIDVGVHVEEDAQFVFGDQQRLAQVLVNLATNAVKFTPAGGRVDLTAAREDNDLVLAVRDTGIGVLPEQRQVIFESFSQGQRLDMSRAPEGAGVGLALVNGLVRLHGGQISLESQPDQGSTFVVRLPGALSSMPTSPHVR